MGGRVFNTTAVETMSLCHSHVRSQPCCVARTDSFTHITLPTPQLHTRYNSYVMGRRARTAYYRYTCVMTICAHTPQSSTLYRRPAVPCTLNTHLSSMFNHSDL